MLLYELVLWLSDLVFGSHVRGLQFCEICRSLMQQNLTLTYNKLIAEINDKIATGCRLARKNSEELGELQRQYVNNVRQLISLKPEDEVLVLLAGNSRNLLTCCVTDIFKMWTQKEEED